MDKNDSLGSEMRVVDEIVDALDLTIHEPVGPDTRTCVTHGLEFLEDHLRRLYGLEERGNLLDIVVSVHPELAAELHRLQAEHDAIRTEAHRLVMVLEDKHKPSDASLQGIMRGLRHLIGEILKHEKHERTVLLDSTHLDCGGEG
jgi:hypothetical protein